jgi:hypothetical protein
VLPNNQDAPFALRRGSCSDRCPSISVTQDQTDTQSQILLPLQIINFIFACHLLFTWTVFPQKRAQLMNLLFIISIWLWSFFGILAYGFVYKPNVIGTLVCSDNSTRYIPGSGFCLFSGLSAIFLENNVFCLWLFQNVDLFMKTVMLWNFTASQQKRNYMIYAFISYTWPTIQVIVLAQQQLMSGSGKGTFPGSYPNQHIKLRSSHLLEIRCHDFHLFFQVLLLYQNRFIFSD